MPRHGARGIGARAAVTGDVTSRPLSTGRPVGAGSLRMFPGGEFAVADHADGTIGERVGGGRPRSGTRAVRAKLYRGAGQSLRTERKKRTREKTESLQLLLLLQYLFYPLRCHNVLL